VFYISVGNTAGRHLSGPERDSHGDYYGTCRSRCGCSPVRNRLRTEQS
jgi:hypothetical protein